MGADSRTQTAIPPVDFHSSWPFMMNKRSFIKLFSGMLAGPAVSPLLALLPDSKLKNWAGNVEYGTENLYTANTLEQARDFVRKQSRLKVLGTRHCFHKIASSDPIQLSRQKDGDKFSGAVVGLGALGVITKVTLDIQPAYTMKQYVYLDMPLDQVKEHFDAISSSAYSASLFTDWRNKNVNEVWIKSRVEEGRAFAPSSEFLGAKAATRNFHPIAALSAENCTEQMGVPGPWYERLPHFRMGFTPSAGKELQSEYFVPRRHAVEAILAVERLHEQVSPHLLITEIRTIAADDLWMSPCYKQPSVTIHFTWKPDWPAVRRLLPVIEKELAPFKARPHWGKLFTTSATELKSIYKKMPEFVELCRRYDPQGKFRNEYLNRNIFAT